MFNKIKNKLRDQVKDLAMDSLEDLKLSQVFTGDFMKEFTSFDSIEKFLGAGNFNIGSLADVKNMDMDILNAFVGKNSSFKDWQSMLTKALALLKLN